MNRNKILLSVLSGLLVILAVLISNGYFQSSEFTTQSNHAKKVGRLGVSLPSSALDNDIPTVLNSPPQSMKKVLSDAYRLDVDRRLINVIPIIHQFITKETKGKVQTSFKDGQWNVIYKKKNVIQLPDLPDLSDLTKALIPWTKQLAANNGFQMAIDKKLPEEINAIDQLIDGFFASHQLAATIKLNQLWNAGNHHPQILKNSARTLVLLSLQNFDRLNIADPLQTQAFAMVLLAKSLTKLSLDQEESLLAEIMGYSSHAMKIAQALPKNDPTRLYVNQNNQQLIKLAEENEKNIFAKFLVLNRFAAQKDLAKWTPWMQTHFGQNKISLAILGTGLRLNTFRGKRSYPRLIQGTIAFELLKEDGGKSKTNPIIPTIDKILSNSDVYSLLKALLDLNPDLSNLVTQVEDHLQSNSANYRGPFIDQSVYRSFYESYFYTSLYKEGLFYLDSLASLDAAESFVKELKGSSLPSKVKTKAFSVVQFFKSKINSVFGTKSLVENSFESDEAPNSLPAEFILWYEHLLQPAKGVVNREELISDISNIQHFGNEAFFRTLKSIEKTMGIGDPGQFTVIKRLSRRMDSRISHRIKLGDFAQKKLFDLKLMDRLYKTAFSSNPNFHYFKQTWHAFFSGNTKKLHEIYNNPVFPATHRGRAVAYLGMLKAISHKEQEKKYRNLTQQFPANWNLVADFSKTMKNNEDYEICRSVHQKWLEGDYVVGGLEKIISVNSISECYYLEKNYAEASNWISKVAQSSQGGSLVWNGRILDKLGKTEEALQYFTANFKRYPTSGSGLREILAFYWRHKKFDEAAQFLAKYPYPLSQATWYHNLAKAVAKVTKDQPTEEGEKIFTALQKAGIPANNWKALIPQIAESKNYKLAFHMQSKLAKGGLEGIQDAIIAYKYLKEFETAENSLEWLKQALPQQGSDPVIMIASGHDQHDLVWDFVPKPTAYTWALRAGSTLVLKNISRNNRKALKDHYNQSNVDNHYFPVGKFFLGQITENELLKYAKNTKQRCEYAYFIGFKAQAEGRYEDASDWYRVAIETGLFVQGEYRWAFQNLQIWIAKNMSLPRLAKEGV